VWLKFVYEKSDLIRVAHQFILSFNVKINEDA
jgi:hypothetical protein